MKALIACLFILMASILSHVAIACICLGQEWNVGLVQKNILHSDLVFVGEVVETEENRYSFKVVEAFKGAVQGDTVHGAATGSCSMVPYIDGLWVIYSSADKNGLIDLDICSLSRSLTTFSPVPPYPDSAITESLYKRIRGKELPIAMRDWMNEYSILIGLKEVQPADRGEKKEGKNIFFTYAALGLALVALVVALLKK